MQTKRFRFGTYRFDTGTGILYECGFPVAIGRRAALLLQSLLQAGGNVVTKSELMDAAWPGRCVEEGNISVHISELRKQLRDNAKYPRWITTVAGIGYCFTGPLAADVSGSKQPIAVRCHDEANRHFELGRSLLARSPKGNVAARAHLAKAIQLKPEYSKPYAFLSMGHFGEAQYYRRNIDENYALGASYAEKAVLLDPDDLYLTARMLDPNNPSMLIHMVDINVLKGRAEDAIGYAHRAIGQIGKPTGWYLWNLGYAYYAAGFYEEAVDALRAVEVHLLPAQRILAASLAQLGRYRAARKESGRFMAVNPDFRINGWAAYHPFQHSRDRKHFVDGYAKAGLPM
jgi:DNA-binding winged helix-turn-helix (wHTH) protein